MWIVWTSRGAGQHRLRARTAHYRPRGQNRFLCGRAVPRRDEAIFRQVISGGKRCAVCEKRLKTEQKLAAVGRAPV